MSCASLNKELIDSFLFSGSASVILDQLTTANRSMIKSFVNGASLGIVFGSTVYGFYKIKDYFDEIEEQTDDIQELFERVSECENKLKK